MEKKEEVRIDKYLWSIRLFKTRSLATEACKAGRVKLEGSSIKPSHIVRVAETYSVQKGIDKKIIKVKDILDKRVDAKTAVLYYEDLSPVSDIPRLHSVFTSPVFKRDRGTGRPTKKDRREIDDVQSSWEDE